MVLSMIRETGVYKILGDVKYFIPHPLPPTNPELYLSNEALTLYGEAVFELGKLSEMSRKLPDVSRFINAYIFKEAMLSSEIEGIHTTLIETLVDGVGGAKISKETQLVRNYKKSLDEALSIIKNDGLPIGSRVILAAHKALVYGTNDAAPGEYRKQTVRLSGIDLVPPMAPEIPGLMSDLEKYINDIDANLPPLIRAGLVHLQFETIHPFLDGNGRIGRMLIVLMLLDNKLLGEPIIYPSYYFKKYRLDYYQHLDRVRTHGDFEGWIIYYLKAIIASAKDAHKRATYIEAHIIWCNYIMENDTRFIKNRKTALEVLDFLFQNPIVSVSDVSKGVRKSYNTASDILARFAGAKILSIRTDLTPHKPYHFTSYLEILEKEY